MELNWIAIVLCGVATLVLGALWYAPPLFGKAWARLAQVDEVEAGKGMARKLGLTFVFAIIGAAIFNAFIGPDPAMGFAVGAGASAGLAWVAGSFAINGQFENHPPMLTVINGGYHTFQYTLFGVIFGLL